MTSEYTPGNAVGVIAPDVAVLVGLDAQDALVTELFACVSGSPTLEDIVEVLLSRGLRQLHGFAAATLDPNGVRVVVRGDFTAAVEGEDAVRGSGLLVDRFFADARVVRLTSDAVDGPTLPVLHGVVLADSVRLNRAVREVGTRNARFSESAVGVEVPAWSDPAKPDEAPATSLADASGALPDPDLGSIAIDPVGRDEAEVAVDPAGLRDLEVEPPASPDVAVDESMWHASAAEDAATPISGPAEPSSVGELDRADDSLGGWPPGSDAAWTRLAGEPGSPRPKAPDTNAEPVGGMLIESFPWASSGDVQTPIDLDPVAVSATPSRSLDPSDFDVEAAEMTIDRSRLIGHALSSSSVLVVAARCPSGHLSPAYADGCRVCHQALPPQQPMEVPRPQLGVLRLSNGDSVPLDRGVILGRNPRLPAGYSGEQPNLVRLADPDKDISSQHLEVTLDYWHVLITDLGSTNGTEVILPGQPPVQLRRDDPMTIEPGTKVVLAGVFDFVYEVTA